MAAGSGVRSLRPISVEQPQQDKPGSYAAAGYEQIHKEKAPGPSAPRRIMLR